jgi:WD40 repeat protein
MYGHFRSERLALSQSGLGRCMRMWIETSTVLLRTLVLSAILLTGCTPFREATEPPGTAAAPSGTREPPTAPIARIESGAHTAAIYRIDTDAPGRLLVTGSEDKTVRLSSLSDGKPLKTLRVPIGGGNEGKVYAMAISPDGNTVAAGGWTGYEWDGSVSIYLFEVASGRLVRRLRNFRGAIGDLSFSPDGRWLVAGLGGGLENGIRVYRTGDWELVYVDADYGERCTSVDFAADGRLVSTSLDGHLRLYALVGEGFLRLAKEKAPGGGRPFAARFSPDGKQIAVGFHDSTVVNVLDGDNLAFQFEPESDGVDNGNLATVAWSPDSQFLYAGGLYQDRAGFNLIRRWDESGRGPYRDLPASVMTIMDLESLEAGRLVYGSGDAVFGVFDARGRKLLDRPSGIADLRGMGSAFLVSRDGRTIQFRLGYGGGRPTGFSLDSHLIDTGSGENTSMRPPRFEAAGIRVADWTDTTEPKLNGKPLALMPYEFSRSLAVHPDGHRFLLGTDWYLRYFDTEGRELWRMRPQPPGGSTSRRTARSRSRPSATGPCAGTGSVRTGGKRSWPSSRTRTGSAGCSGIPRGSSTRRPVRKIW